MKRKVYFGLLAGGVLLALVGLVAAQTKVRLPETIDIASGAALPQDNTTLATLATDPVLFFSDLTSGPRTGNGDTSGGRSGQDGAIVTLWGRNLGSSQGTSSLSE